MAAGATRLATQVIMLAKSLVLRILVTPYYSDKSCTCGCSTWRDVTTNLAQNGKTSYHYGISIIRDRGIIDNEALSWIEQRHGTEGIVFVDGWTGKGAITNELIRSLAGREGFPAQPHLVVLADPLWLRLVKCQ